MLMGARRGSFECKASTFQCLEPLTNLCKANVWRQVSAGCPLSAPKSVVQANLPPSNSGHRAKTPIETQSAVMMLVDLKVVV